MQELKQQVARARRRLTLQLFVATLPWTLFACLSIACLAIAIPKIWALSFAGEDWTWGWLGGAVAAGLLSAMVITAIRRRDSLAAAIEIDHRFGLKERVSSTLALPGELRESAAGQALVDDAVKRVTTIDVRDEFHVRPSWHGLLPVAAGALALLLAYFIDDATQRTVDAATVDVAQMQKQISKNAEDLKKRLAKRKKEAKEAGLKDADQLFDKIEEGLDDIQKNNSGDFKKTLVQINDLTKDLEKKRERLANTRDLQKQFGQLNKIQQGPAEKVAKALKEGNFNKAIDQLNELQKKMENGQLTEEQKQQLQNQVKEMKDQLQKMVDAQNQQKKQLEEQIEQKKREGDTQGAEELQRQLDQMNQQNQQMDRLQQMANQLGQCQQSMQNGDQQGASEAMSQLAQSLQDMQSELDQLETISDAMDQIADAKDAICQSSDGMMSQMSPMSGMNGRMGQMPGDGMGDGRGQGDRPEEETEIGSYDAREKGKIQRGEAVRTGDAFGPNQTGRSLVDVQEEIESAISEDPDPIINERLPRTEKRHANEYFERVRKGK